MAQELINKINAGNSAQFKQFGAPLALFREQFESDSRQFKSNSRQLALWRQPSPNLAHLAAKSLRRTAG